MGFYRGPKIITNGLVLYLDAGNYKSFLTGTTVWNDLSGNGNNGSLINNSTFSTENKGSLTFNGNNQYISTNNYSLDFGIQSFTLSAWIKTSNNIQQGKIINKGQSSAFPLKSKGYSLRFYDRAMFSVSANDTDFLSLNTKNINDIPNNVWKLFVGVCNRETLTQSIYIDGIFNISTGITYGSISNPDAELTIGNLNRGIYGVKAEYFNGNISQVMIYNRALSSSEILQNYNATKSRFNL